jgi:hypothetical protein
MDPRSQHPKCRKDQKCQIVHQICRQVELIEIVDKLDRTGDNFGLQHTGG